jgi:hypothetical protein
MDDGTSKVILATLDFLGKLAWPGALLFIVFSFRRQVGELLNRLGSLKVAGSEWVFQRQTADAPEPSNQLKKTELEVGPDGFLKASSIRAAVAESGLPDKDDPITGELLIFQTPNQKTWLVATKKTVFILLDDASTRQASRLIQSAFDKNRTLPLKFDTSDGEGVVKFAAEDEWWYYSLYLFPTTGALQKEVTRLVKRGA